MSVMSGNPNFGGMEKNISDDITKNKTLPEKKIDAQGEINDQRDLSKDTYDPDDQVSWNDVSEDSDKKGLDDTYDPDDRVRRKDDLLSDGAKDDNEINRTMQYSDLDDMKNDLGDDFDDILKGKPKNSPALDKWFEAGGSIKIEKRDGHNVWTYIDKEGRTVEYVDGYPKFPSDAKHPFIEDINIGNFSNSHDADKRAYIKILKERYGLTEIPKGYDLHHDIINGNLQLIKSDYHREFRHQGGFSKFREDD